MTDDEAHAEMQGIINKTIYLKVRYPEYIVALPLVIRAASMFDPNRLPDKPNPIIVAVYQLAEAGYGDNDWNKYEFVGVELR